jgi:hypothetical protein
MISLNVTTESAAVVVSGCEKPESASALTAGPKAQNRRRHPTRPSDGTGWFIHRLSAAWPGHNFHRGDVTTVSREQQCLASQNDVCLHSLGFFARDARRGDWSNGLCMHGLES